LEGLGCSVSEVNPVQISAMGDSRRNCRWVCGVDHKLALLVLGAEDKRNPIGLIIGT
jgi:hypothetical protein